MLSAMSSHRRVLYVLPTGGGKTIMFCHIAQQATEKGKKVMILVHRDKLFKQTSESLGKFGVRHGLIGSGYAPSYAHNCQVAKIGTVVNRLDKFIPDLIIVDECHHATAGQYRKILDAYPNAFVLGFTATPCRTDGTGLGEVFDIMVEGPQIYELIDMNYLTPARLFAPETVNMAGVKMMGGDYNSKQLGEVMEKPKIIGSAVGHYRDICSGSAAVVFCVSINHSIMMRDQFRKEGYISEVVHGKMKQHEIDAVLRGLGDGSIHVVTSCDLISEGVDVPKIECAILQRPTASLSLYLQQVGRALRKSEGKDECIILDHVGNIERHGRYDDHREWTLEGMKKKKNKDEQEVVTIIRECPECAWLLKPGQRKCPDCGCHGNIKERVVEVVNGKLIELERKAKEKAEKKAEEKDARTAADFIQIATQRGHELGWALGRFKHKVTIAHGYANPETMEEKKRFCDRYDIEINIYLTHGLEKAIYEAWNLANR